MPAVGKLSCPSPKTPPSRGGDPRLSLAERYPLPPARAAKFHTALARLQRDRLLTEEDAAKLADQVSADWLPNRASSHGSLRPVGAVQPWFQQYQCSWWLSREDGKRHLASIGQGDGVVLSLSDAAFDDWSEEGQPAVELTFDRNPARRIKAAGWVSKGGGSPAMFGLYLDASARRAMAGAKRLELSRDGKPMIDLFLAETPSRAELNACVPPPKGPNSDEE